jgi:hypothetical protein
MNNKLRTLVAILALAVFSSASYAETKEPSEHDVKEMDRIRTKVQGSDELEVLQKNFSDNPNFSDCVVIFDRVGHVLKQYERSIEYGNRCLELPHQSKNGDWLIHYWLADFYNKNNDIEHSMFHLRLALKQDTKNTILENHWLSQSGLEGIYAKIKP